MGVGCVVGVCCCVCVVLVGKDGMIGLAIGCKIGIVLQLAQVALLMKLVAKIFQEFKLVGDATFVLRLYYFLSGYDFIGVDFYFDNGEYYYGQTLDELKVNVKADPTDQEGYQVVKAEREAAVAANMFDGDVACEKMIVVMLVFDNSVLKLTLQQKVDVVKEQVKMVVQKLVVVKKVGIKVGLFVSQCLFDNNRVWIGVMDVLIEGVGDLQVCSGVMQLMNTMFDVVKVIQGDGMLMIIQMDFLDGYIELFVVDDKIGIFIREVGGVLGRIFDVMVDYDIKCVMVFDIIGY